MRRLIEISKLPNYSKEDLKLDLGDNGIVDEAFLEELKNRKIFSIFFLAKEKELIFLDFIDTKDLIANRPMNRIIIRNHFDIWDTNQKGIYNEPAFVFSSSFENFDSNLFDGDILIAFK